VLLSEGRNVNSKQGKKRGSKEKRYKVKNVGERGRNSSREKKKGVIRGEKLLEPFLKMSDGPEGFQGLKMI